MKKALIAAAVIASAIGFTQQAKAQSTPHAIGLHIGGSTMDLEYQYHFSQENFLDVTAGLFDLGDGMSVQGIYNWNFQEWSDWTPNFGTWKAWGGLGAGIGYVDNNDNSGLTLGPAATLGFGFTLKDAPVTIGIDYRPWLGLCLGNDSGIVGKGFFNFGLTATYRF